MKVSPPISEHGRPKAGQQLDLVEHHVVEAVLCNPELLSGLNPRKRNDCREALADYLGHEIPDHYFRNPLSRNYRERLQAVVAAEGITLKSRDYMTLGALLLALKPHLVSPVSGECSFPDGTLFSDTHVTMGGKKAYPLHVTASGRVRIGRGNHKLSADALFWTLVDTYGKPAGAPPAWLTGGTFGETNQDTPGEPPASFLVRDIEKSGTKCRVLSQFDKPVSDPLADALEAVSSAELATCDEPASLADRISRLSAAFAPKPTANLLPAVDPLEL